MNIEKFEDIIYEKEDNGICTITFNRPERRNAFTRQTFIEIKAVLEDMEQDKNARVLIMTGCNEANAFSSGGYFNLKFFASPSQVKRNKPQKREDIRFWDFSKIVIAAINGLAIGAGITMPLAGADLIYMSADAWLEFNFVKRGIIAQSAMSFILPFYLGFQKAKEILYFGNKITAQDAEKLGLVNKVLPSAELMPYVHQIAERLIPPKGPSMAIKLMKKTIHNQFREIIINTSDLEKEANRIAFKTHDFREAIRAFTMKREPKFKGK
jgi:2-(1,2-epoxy-1,2-dihydrophenyl)acetyl-CoA isomerase